jgi:hypothetical protein
MIELAQTGDVTAAKFLMSAVGDIRTVELTGADGAPVSFAQLAEKARQEAKDRTDAT